MPVAGYTAQSDFKVHLANEGKELEERYMRWLDKLQTARHVGPTPDVLDQVTCDPRMIALARTNMQQTAMWAIRSIYQPTRIKLPEDPA